MVCRTPQGEICITVYVISLLKRHTADAQEVVFSSGTSIEGLWILDASSLHRYPRTRSVLLYTVHFCWSAIDCKRPKKWSIPADTSAKGPYMDCRSPKKRSIPAIHLLQNHWLQMPENESKFQQRFCLTVTDCRRLRQCLFKQRIC